MSDVERQSGLPATNFVVRGLIYLIELYRHTVSPLRLPTCRFTPTCSQYAVAALTEFGLIRGGWLTLVRLAKCGPWHAGGWDPIPDRPGDGPASASVTDGRNESHV
ncbi:MAG TPA: membrane protein insertion efficiency factor YidD [Mycobacterium sp.]|nr:membrane protein insertion efficiency factor YidD [Mycobacterium sp.]